MIRHFLDPKNDRAFKRIFGREENKNILLKMLNTLLGEEFHKELIDLHYLPRTQNPDDMDCHKESVIEVLCRDRDRSQYIIVMEVVPQDQFQKSARYYAAKSFINQAKNGTHYHRFKKFIFLAFVDFELFPNKNGYKSKLDLLDSKTKENDLDMFSFTFIELPKFLSSFKKRNVEIASLSEEETFYYFLKEAEGVSKKQLEALIERNAILEKAFHEIEKKNWDEDAFADYKSVEKEK